MNRKQVNKKKNRNARIRRTAFIEGRRLGQKEACDEILNRQKKLNEAACEIESEIFS